MTSKIKVDNINKISDDSNIIKKCGTTTTIGSGASNPIVVDGSAVTIGRCGGTVSLASGATQTGFGSTYSAVDFDTTKKTTTFTAVAGKGYFCDTTGGSFTCNLPSSPSAGDCVALKDYAKTFGTNALTIGRGGSDIDGGAFDSIMETDYESVMFVYVDATQGWKSIISNNGFYGAAYVVASGGNSTATSGDYKIHTFTSPGTFTVTGGSGPLGFVEYIVVGGGGGGSNHTPLTGGGGAGGFRFASPSLAPLTYPAKPVAAPAGLTVTSSPGVYPVTVGAGGSNSSIGASSTFGPLTAAGGGINNATPACHNGGSGAGQGGGGSLGSGNTPPVSPPQGNDGGANFDDGGSNKNGGGGGGAITAGVAPGTSPSPTVGGAGGGVPNAFGTSGQNCGSLYYFAGGGGGGSECMGTSPGGLGGGGAGGRRPGTPVATAGTANTGGGGGGRSEIQPGPTPVGSAGGSGIVIIRYRFQ